MRLPPLAAPFFCLWLELCRQYRCLLQPLAFVPIVLARGLGMVTKVRKEADFSSVRALWAAGPVDWGYEQKLWLAFPRRGLADRGR